MDGETRWVGIGDGGENASDDESWRTGIAGAGAGKASMTDGASEVA